MDGVACSSDLGHFGVWWSQNSIRTVLREYFSHLGVALKSNISDIITTFQSCLMQRESSCQQQAGILQSRNDNQGGEAKKCLVLPNCGKGGQNYCSGSLNHGRVHILLCRLVFLAVFLGTNHCTHTHGGSTSQRLLLFPLHWFWLRYIVLYFHQVQDET